MTGALPRKLEDIEAFMSKSRKLSYGRSGFKPTDLTVAMVGKR
jgi:hypothetical protein